MSNDMVNKFSQMHENILNHMGMSYLKEYDEKKNLDIKYNHL